jgi:hypothetical protein
MSDVEAMLCAAYDGVSCLMAGKHVLVSVEWMIKEKPRMADDLRKFVGMAQKATSTTEQ